VLGGVRWIKKDGRSIGDVPASFVA
jgi:hypothetical protein